jgi:hypothetical protein
MTQTCSFCKSEISAIRAGGCELRICSKCHSTFILARQFGAVRRDLDSVTRRKWADQLIESAKTFCLPQGPIPCIDHGEPLQQGTLPDVSIPGLVAPCCSVLHLPPQVMLELLERSLKASAPSFTSKHKKPSLWQDLAGFFFKRVVKDSAPVDDGLAGAMWDIKLKTVFEKKH